MVVRHIWLSFTSKSAFSFSKGSSLERIILCSTNITKKRFLTISIRKSRKKEQSHIIVKTTEEIEKIKTQITKAYKKIKKKINKDNY